MNLYACSRLVEGACLEFVQVDALAVAGAEPVSAAVTSLTAADQASTILWGFALVFIPALIAWIVNVHVQVLDAGEGRS